MAHGGSGSAQSRRVGTGLDGSWVLLGGGSVWKADRPCRWCFFFFSVPDALPYGDTICLCFCGLLFLGRAQHVSRV